MKFWTASKQEPRAWKCAAAGLMVFLWLGTCLLASSPQLHRLLHSDAQKAAHQCLVTQIKEHSLLASCAGVVLPLEPPALLTLVAFADSEFVSAIDHRLSPKRGPPALFSSTTVAG